MMNKRFLIALRTHFLLLVATLVSWLVPRTRGICVVGGSRGKRFADNAKHFFLLAQQQSSKPTFVWLSSNKAQNQKLRALGFRAHTPTSLQGVYFGFRAAWHIFDVKISDTSEYTSIGAKQLNLWHGIPLKRLAPASGRLAQPKVFRFLKYLNRYNRKKKFFAHPAPVQFSYISEIFDVPRENILTTNLPRNHVLLNKDSLERPTTKGLISDMELEIRKELKQHQGKVIGYFPTWRETGHDHFLGATQPAEIEALNRVLKEQNALLVTKWHTCSYEEYKHRGMSHTAVAIDQLLLNATHIKMLPFDTDLNTQLDRCDMLISDYSGVLIDYLLLDRPMMMAIYDYERYKTVTGLLAEFDSFNAGPKANNFSEALELLDAYLNEPDGFSENYARNRLALRKLYFANESSVEILVEHILN